MKTYTIKYFHPFIAIGLEDIRNAWLLLPGKQPVKLKTVIHQGNLTYRVPVSDKRISYRSIKNGLIKKQIIIREAVYPMPF